MFRFYQTNIVPICKSKLFCYETLSFLYSGKKSYDAYSNIHITANPLSVQNIQFEDLHFLV